MKTDDFIDKFTPCAPGAAFARQFETMEEVWDNCQRPDWLSWMLEEHRCRVAGDAARLAAEKEWRIHPAIEKAVEARAAALRAKEWAKGWEGSEEEWEAWGAWKVAEVEAALAESARESARADARADAAAAVAAARGAAVSAARAEVVAAARWESWESSTVKAMAASLAASWASRARREAEEAEAEAEAAAARREAAAAERVQKDASLAVQCSMIKKTIENPFRK